MQRQAKCWQWMGAPTTTPVILKSKAISILPSMPTASPVHPSSQLSTQRHFNRVGIPVSSYQTRKPIFQKELLEYQPHAFPLERSTVQKITAAAITTWSFPSGKISPIHLTFLPSKRLSLPGLIMSRIWQGD